VSRKDFAQLFYGATNVEQFENLIEKVKNEEGYVFWDFFRDAWIATAFARARRLTKVFLIEKEWADFRITDGDGKTWDFEATEAFEPGRLRDDEYKEIRNREALGLSTWEYDPVENWLTPSKAREWLSRAFQTKINKNYPSKAASLVIYLNASAYRTDTKGIEATFAEAFSTSQQCFEQIWVLWEGRAYPIAQAKNL